MRLAVYGGRHSSQPGLMRPEKTDDQYISKSHGGSRKTSVIPTTLTSAVGVCMLIIVNCPRFLNSAAP